MYGMCWVSEGGDGVWEVDVRAAAGVSMWDRR